ncbi:hypothetical protein BD309DRAFT_967008 [Dichomitus squalens]|uniref:Uncharacterized protein n=1 Tax=Dichomitus squalens TaxID=114155 RepID=A0A4V6MWU7_9APHY|nr:hypothetical protein BD309DRAFT_967008 [Dichomitus squalens]TBU60198.1 hypothetical protein BD310DRAFT_923528 [Dichomitus squalens]
MIRSSYKGHAHLAASFPSRRLSRSRVSRTSSSLISITPTLLNTYQTMSSPIAIPSVSTNTQRESSPNTAARSLPGDHTNGLYVPVHRRGASASSTSSSSFPEHGSLSPVARSTGPRTRSVSPMPRTPRSPSRTGKRHLDISPMPSPRPANIPLASKIPNTYTLTELLALSSSPAPLTPSQRMQIDAHIPFMTRRPSKAKAAPSGSSAPSSPPSTTAPLPTPTPAPIAKSNADAQKTRRRRPGRKNSSGKPRVAPAVGADVENRRRRVANWGWAAHGGSTLEQESWRAHALPMAA